MKDKLLQLIKGHFIQRCPRPKKKGAKIPEFEDDERELYM